jgi:hypothetical protein
MITVGDLNGNGSDEVVVFGRRTDGFNQKANIKDSATGEWLNTVYYDKTFIGLDMAACPDINNNGSEELVMLGRRASDGKYQAIIKDSKTDALIAKIDM